MKKLAVFLVVVWILIGSASLFVWLKVGKSLTVENLTTQANQVARELELPWALRFKKVQPSYGADFRVRLEGIEAIAADGTRIFAARAAEVRLPWTIFFSHNPVRVNIAISDVAVTDWARVLSEVETYLDARQTDRAQQISLPAHLVQSTFNLRFTKLEGPWRGKPLVLSKLYLLNIDPKKPTAFEAVFPWETQWGGARVSGETKALGEYRFSRHKIDLHYYLRTRLQLTHGTRQRSGDFSVEGKGFYHPRMGLFSTLSAKDDWIGLVGDLEWTPQQFKWNVPKFSLSHEFLLDVSPFTHLHSGSGIYQTSAISGEFRWTHSKEEQLLKASLKSRGNTKVTDATGQEHQFDLNLVVRGPDSAEGTLAIDKLTWINYKHGKGTSLLQWNPALFVALPPEGTPWYAPHHELWDVAWWLPWSRLSATAEGVPSYTLERLPGSLVKVSQFSPRPELPKMTLTRAVGSAQLQEWSAQFDAQALDNLFQLTGQDFLLVPGHAYTGQLWHKESGEANMKLAWKGGALALLSRSSCKALMQEKPEFKTLLNDTFTNQAELTWTPPLYRLNKWVAKAGGVEWEVAGEWSNSPIKCQLKIKQRVGKKKPVTHEVTLN